MNKRDNLSAALKRAEWRREGVPTLITAHEAFRLTGGAIGVQGDHCTPVRLTDAAVAITKRATAQR